MTWIQLNDLICPLYLAESNEPLALLLVFNSIHSVFVDHLVANSKSISNTIILYPMFHSSWTWSYSDRTIQLYYPFFPYNFLLKFKISSPPFYIYDTPRVRRLRAKSFIHSLVSSFVMPLLLLNVMSFLQYHQSLSKILCFLSNCNNPM